MKQTISNIATWLVCLTISVSTFAQEKAFSELAEIPEVHASYLNGEVMDIELNAIYFKSIADCQSITKVIAMETISYIDYDENTPLSEAISTPPPVYNTDRAKEIVEKTNRIIKKLKLQLVSEQKQKDLVNNIYISPTTKKNGKTVKSILIYQICGNIFHLSYITGEIEPNDTE